MKIFRIGLVVSALAFAGAGVFNCGGSSDSGDGTGGKAGSDSGGGGKAGGGGSSSGGGGGSASGSGGAAASGGSGGAAMGGKGGGGGAGGAGGAAGGAGGAMGGAGGTAAVVTYDGKAKAIFTGKCGGCHTSAPGSGGLDLREYAQTQKAGGGNCAGKKVGECALARIKAGSMPKGKNCTGTPATDSANADCLTKAQQDDLQAWIDGGMKEK